MKQAVLSFDLRTKEGKEKREIYQRVLLDGLAKVDALIAEWDTVKSDLLKEQKTLQLKLDALWLDIDTSRHHRGMGRRRKRGGSSEEE